MTLATVAALTRLLTDADWSPLEIKFKHRAPRNTAEHERLFGSTISFGGAANQVVFDAKTLSLPVVKADPRLCALLDRHAEALLAKYPRQDTLIDRVRSIIRNELNGGDPSLERVAGELALSPRTMQRRLREQGSSHQELLDQLRRDLAISYLREPEMALCEVAYLLGFSESSAFHRAFKRWTGMTPGEFRER